MGVRKVLSAADEPQDEVAVDFNPRRRIPVDGGCLRSMCGEPAHACECCPHSAELDAASNGADNDADGDGEEDFVGPGWDNWRFESLCEAPAGEFDELCELQQVGNHRGARLSAQL